EEEPRRAVVGQRLDRRRRQHHHEADEVEDDDRRQQGVVAGGTEAPPVAPGLAAPADRPADLRLLRLAPFLPGRRRGRGLRLDDAAPGAGRRPRPAGGAGAVGAAGGGPAAAWSGDRRAEVVGRGHARDSRRARTSRAKSSPRAAYPVYQSNDAQAGDSRTVSPGSASSAPSRTASAIDPARRTGRKPAKDASTSP